MNYQNILMVVIALVLGMLVANILKGVCGCKVVEGQCGTAEICEWNSSMTNNGVQCGDLVGGGEDPCLDTNNNNGAAGWGNPFVFDPTYTETTSWRDTICCQPQRCLSGTDCVWNPNSVLDLSDHISGDVEVSVPEGGWCGEDNGYSCSDNWYTPKGQVCCMYSGSTEQTPSPPIYSFNDQGCLVNLLESSPTIVPSIDSPTDPSTCKGDINNDEVVNVDDLLSVLSNYRITIGPGDTTLPQDITGDHGEPDGVVDVQDVLGILALQHVPCSKVHTESPQEQEGPGN